MRLKLLLLLFIGVDVLLISILLSISFLSPKKRSPALIDTKNENQVQKENQSSNTPLPAPNILSRDGWKAKQPLGEIKQHIPQHITIHHTAAPQKEGVLIEKKMQQLQDFSQKQSRLSSGRIKPAWPDVPYHYFIAVDGTIAEGREIKYVGDTNTDYDPTGHAQVVLEGNFEEEQPSIKQLESLYELASWLATHWQIRVSEIKCHNDYAATACPGTNLKQLLPMIRQRVGKSIGVLGKE